MEISHTEMAWSDLNRTTVQILKITNNGKTKQVLKLKCSDNELFFINPVFSVINPGKTAEAVVSREAAPKKPDKIVVCMAEATDAECKNIAGHFKKPTTRVTEEQLYQTFPKRSSSHSPVRRCGFHKWRSVRTGRYVSMKKQK